MKIQVNRQRQSSAKELGSASSPSGSSNHHDNHEASLHWSTSNSQKQSNTIMSRISIFDNNNKPTHLPVKVGSPVMNKEKMRKYKQDSQSPKPCARHKTTTKLEGMPLQLSGPPVLDSPAPTTVKQGLDLSEIYEAPLSGVPSRKEAIRACSVQNRLIMFERKNTETLSQSHHSRPRRSSVSKYSSLKKAEPPSTLDVEGVLSPRHSFKSRPKGGRSSDPISFVSPGRYQGKIKQGTTSLPKAPLLDEAEKKPKGTLRRGKLDSDYASNPNEPYNPSGEQQHEEYELLLKRNTFHGYNRPDPFSSTLSATLRQSWKDRQQPSKDIPSSSEHSNYTMGSVKSDDSSEFANESVRPAPKRSWRPKQQGTLGDGKESCSSVGQNSVAAVKPATSEGEMELKMNSCENLEIAPKKRGWKAKREISLEEMNRVNTGSNPAQAGHESPVQSPTHPARRTWKSKQRNHDTDSPRSAKTSLDSGSSHGRKSDKLRNRIKMFNEASPAQPEPTFIGSRYRNKLVQKQKDETTTSDLLRLKNNVKLQDEPSEPNIQSKGPVKGEVRGDRATDQDDAQDLKPKMSLDKAAVSAKNRSQKEKNKNVNRRGKLKAKRSALIGQKNKDKNAVFASTVVSEEDLSRHVPPEFAKEPADNKIILNALRKNFVFEEMDEKEMEKLAAAMQQIKVCKDEVIIKQGDDGDYFYVVARGEVSYHVNGKKVGSSGPGNAFGEIALLYTCPRAATVKAETQPTTLFQVGQRTFRFMTQSETKKSEQEKKRLLQEIPFLSTLGEEDITRLCSVMKPVLFYTGDYIVQKGENGSSFFIIQDGKVRVTEIFVGGTSYEDISLGKGDYFGEDALVLEEPRAANVVALTNGTAFSIDQENVRKVLGDFASLVSKAQDRQRLESMKILRDADLSSSDFDSLAKLITDKAFAEKEKVFDQNDFVEAAMYIVREGSVRITALEKQQDDVIGIGGAFGQDHLLAIARRDHPSDCFINAQFTATVESDCICGILTLEDCRTIFDIASLGDRIFSGGNSAVEQRRATMKELMQSNVKLEDLDKDHIIGEGQFGTVWLVRADPHKTNERSQMLEFAMKVQFKEDPVRRDGALEAIKREMTVIDQLNHPFIIDLVDKYETEDQLMMLTESVKGGELWSRIHQEDDEGNWTSGMGEADANFYSLVVADTLAYMHRQKIIFRDLKPENVLIDEQGYPRLCDFGFAKYCPDKTFTFCGTPNYLAPEIVLNRGHGAAVDHWALGIVIYEMITGENPFYFEGQDQMSLLQAIVQEDYYPLPDTLSKKATKLMDAILEKYPIQRIGSLAGGEKGILKHEWFSDLDINQIRNKTARAPYIPKLS